MLVRYLTFILCAFVLATTGITRAATTDWHDLGGGKARLLLSHDPTTKTLSAAVEIDLAKGWSTYWRYPGSTGIPPIFDFSQTAGLNITQTLFQSPQLLGSKPTYAGYKKKAVFLMSGKLDTSLKSPVKLDMIIGLCSEICVPAKTQFEVPRSALNTSDGTATRVISFAKLKLPEPIEASAVKLEKSQSSNSLLISVSDNPDWSEPKLFVEGPTNWYLTPAKLVSRESGKLTFELSLSNVPTNTNVLAQKLRYTLTTNTKSFEFRD